MQDLESFIAVVMEDRMEPHYHDFALHLSSLGLTSDVIRYHLSSVELAAVIGRPAGLQAIASIFQSALTTQTATRSKTPTVPSKEVAEVVGRAGEKNVKLLLRSFDLILARPSVLEACRQVGIDAVVLRAVKASELDALLALDEAKELRAVERELLRFRVAAWRRALDGPAGYEVPWRDS